MVKHLGLILLAGLLLGCTTTAGRSFNTSAADHIFVGHTTEGDVVTMLGVPLTQQKLTNGITIYNYRYGHSWPLGFGTSVDSLQLQFVDGVVTDKWEYLAAQY